MKVQIQGQAVDRKKAVAIGALFAISAAILLLGLGFTAFSAVHRAEFAVLGAGVPGVAFGAVVAFLGARYFLSVMRLKNEVYRPDSQFSWGNFKKK